MKRVLMSLFVLIAAAPIAHSDIVSSAPDHFVLRIEGVSPLDPYALWERLVTPADWWSPEHTYSGDASNLSLDPIAGGLWREDWNGGSVAHGTVLAAQPATMLRLDAPFGPLQAMAVETVWTISIEPSDNGSRVVFDIVSTGSEASDLNALASAVDRVNTEAMQRLTSTIGN